MKLEMEDRILAWCKNHGFRVHRTQETNCWQFNNPVLGLNLLWLYQRELRENFPRSAWEVIECYTLCFGYYQLWSAEHRKDRFSALDRVMRSEAGQTIERCLWETTGMSGVRLKFLTESGHLVILDQTDNQLQLNWSVRNNSITILSAGSRLEQPLVARSGNNFPALTDTPTLDMWRSWLCGSITAGMLFEFIFEKHPFLAKYA